METPLLSSCWTVGRIAFAHAVGPRYHSPTLNGQAERRNEKMGGFEHIIVEEPKKIENLKCALKSFRRYLKTTKLVDIDGYDWTGITGFNVYKSEDDIVSWTQNQETGEYEAADRVKDYFDKETCQQLRNGKWIIWWFEIAWIHKVPLSVLRRLKTTCEEHGCLWFWDTLAGDSENWYNLSSDYIKKAFGNVTVYDVTAEWR